MGRHIRCCHPGEGSPSPVGAPPPFCAAAPVLAAARISPVLARHATRPSGGARFRRRAPSESTRTTRRSRGRDGGLRSGRRTRPPRLTIGAPPPIVGRRPMPAPLRPSPSAAGAAAQAQAGAGAARHGTEQGLRARLLGLSPRGRGLLWGAGSLLADPRARAGRAPARLRPLPVAGRSHRRGRVARRALVRGGRRAASPTSGSWRAATPWPSSSAPPAAPATSCPARTCSTRALPPGRSGAS